MNVAYVVKCFGGEYDSSFERNVKIFLDKDRAESYKSVLEHQQVKLDEIYDQFHQFRFKWESQHPFVGNSLNDFPYNQQLFQKRCVQRDAARTQWLADHNVGEAERELYESSDNFHVIFDIDEVEIE